jgi:uncharacterized membrane protein
MEEKMSKNDLIQMIMEDDKLILEDDEIIELLIRERVSVDLNSIHNERLTFGQHVADKMAKVAGSWAFIITFLSILVIWITSNVIFLMSNSKTFDPYPFILLNLILSCLAALQAPVIMMSQNRQEEKDRLRAKNDYKVNLKSEIIVEDIHLKLDELLLNQKHLIERVIELEKSGLK